MERATSSGPRRRATSSPVDAATYPAFGLYFYNSRYYDSYLNRFISPDSIIPDPANPQDLNRYSYARNNPLKYSDPTGHFPWLLIPLLLSLPIILTSDVPSSNNTPHPFTVADTEATRNFYKQASVSGLPQRLIDNYVDRIGEYKLTAGEMMECNPVVDIQNSVEFQSEYQALSGRGGGTSYINGSTLAGAATNGTLGTFTANYGGTLSVDAAGNWAFDGNVDFYDDWNFDPRPLGERPLIAELKVRIHRFGSSW